MPKQVLCIKIENISNIFLSSFTPHYENLPMQYYQNCFGCENENFHGKKFNIFAQNILWVHVRTASANQEVVQTSTHNLCFGTKIRNIVHHCITQFYCMKVGYEGSVGVYLSMTFS